MDSTCRPRCLRSVEQLSVGIIELIRLVLRQVLGENSSLTCAEFYEHTSGAAEGVANSNERTSRTRVLPTPWSSDSKSDKIFFFVSKGTDFLERK